MSLPLFSLLCVAVAVTAQVKGPLSPDFSSWLQSNGYGKDNFERSDYGSQGSYGGKTSAKQNITRTPVIFVHGNSDSALKTAGVASGWDNTIQYFLQQGYTPAELYATSWGDNQAMNAAKRTHDCATVGRVRRFMEAVKNYTGAEKISIISHSMGVTLARKAIKGGSIADPAGACTLGARLEGVDAFVGLSGANLGLCSCQYMSSLAGFAATCNSQTGFWPGDSCGMSFLCGFSSFYSQCSGAPKYSSFLTELNNDPQPVAEHVLSAWSSSDDLIMYGTKVWGKPTCLIPNSNDQKVYTGLTHMKTKETTAADQFNYITKYTV